MVFRVLLKIGIKNRCKNFNGFSELKCISVTLFPADFDHLIICENGDMTDSYFYYSTACIQQGIKKRNSEVGPKMKLDLK